MITDILVDTPESVEYWILWTPTVSTYWSVWIYDTVPIQALDVLPYYTVLYSTLRYVFWHHGGTVIDRIYRTIHWVQVLYTLIVVQAVYRSLPTVEV